MSLLTVEKDLVNEIKSGIATDVGSSAATYYTQWEEVKLMPSVIVSSEGGSEIADTIGIMLYGITVTVLTEPSTSGNPESSHYTLANDVLEYLYEDTRISSFNSASDDTSIGSWRVARTHSTVEKGRVFRTDITLEITAKPLNF